MRFILLFIMFLSTLTQASQITVQMEEGKIELSQLIDASSDIANAVPSSLVHEKIPGQIVYINDVKYQVRFFSFEDTKNTLPKDTTFLKYAVENKIMPLKSAVTKPLDGIEFDSFDFRRAHLNDGVYFSMAVRKVD